MAIIEVRNNYPKAEKLPDAAEKAYKSTKEYSDYLSSKYSCLQGTKDCSVSISPNLLSKQQNWPMA